MAFKSDKQRKGFYGSKGNRGNASVRKIDKRTKEISLNEMVKDNNKLNDYKRKSSKSMQKYINEIRIYRYNLTETEKKKVGKLKKISDKDFNNYLNFRKKINKKYEKRS